MLVKIKQVLFAPPIFQGDEEKTRNARILNGMLSAYLIVMVLLGVASPFLAGTPMAGLVVAGVMGSLTLVSQWLMYRGHVRFAGVLSCLNCGGS
jgi:hypothetical protein